MKIRIDFVTNSSSSSYCVSLGIITSNKRRFKLDPWPNDEDGSCDVDIRLYDDVDQFAAKVGDCSDVQKLQEILTNGIDPGIMSGSEEYTKKLDAFSNKLSQVKSINEIDTIRITEHFSGWGEFTYDGINDFLTKALPDECDIDNAEIVAKELAGKMSKKEIDLLTDQIENHSLSSFEAEILTDISLGKATTTKSYRFSSF